jgi:hypothetical protein
MATEFPPIERPAPFPNATISLPLVYLPDVCPTATVLAVVADVFERDRYPIPVTQPPDVMAPKAYAPTAVFLSPEELLCRAPLPNAVLDDTAPAPLPKFSPLTVDSNRIAIALFL